MTRAQLVLDVPEDWNGDEGEKLGNLIDFPVDLVGLSLGHCDFFGRVALLRLCQHVMRQPDDNDRAQLLLHHLVDHRGVEDQPAHLVLRDRQASLFYDHDEVLTGRHLPRFEQERRVLDAHVNIGARVRIPVVFLQFLGVPSDNSLTILHVVAFNFSILDHDDADKESDDEDSTRDAVVDPVLRLSVCLNTDHEDHESEDFTYHESELLERLSPTMIALLDIVSKQRVLHDGLDQHTRGNP